MQGITVHTVDESAMVWHLNGGPAKFYLKGAQARYAHAVDVDPFPAYPVDARAFEAALIAAAERFPVTHDVEAFLLPRETPDRMNAGTAQIVEWYGEERPDGTPPPWWALITVNAKRIPQHPGTVRYLAAHEYGHVVAHELAGRLMPEEPHNGEGVLYRLYAAMRGLEQRDHSRWGDSVAEVFACDFRVIVATMEVGYWPHPGIPTPAEAGRLEAIIAWWNDVLAGEVPR